MNNYQIQQKKTECEMTISTFRSLARKYPDMKKMFGAKVKEAKDELKELKKLEKAG